MDIAKHSDMALSALDFNALCSKLSVVPKFALEAAQNKVSYYDQFEIKKKQGGVRQISASTGRLKRIQQQLLRGLFSKLAFSEHVHGCVKGRSVVTNAKNHVNQELLVNLDLKDFFSTITQERVTSIFRSQFGLNESSSEILAELCTLNGCLPQGAPTSPALANLAATNLDKAILEVLSTKYNYSRFVDDITISGTKELESLMPQIYCAIQNCGYICNSEKTRILRQSTRQSVTGIIVNKKLSPSKQLIRKTRQDLYYCRKFGLAAHCDWKGKLQNDFIREMHGRIGFIRMTQPELADTFSQSFKEILPSSTISQEIKNILLLKDIIDKELMVTFLYENSWRQVAPTEIYIEEDDDIIAFKGFQFSPEPGWAEYKLSLIEEMDVQKNRLVNG